MTKVAAKIVFLRAKIKTMRKVHFISVNEPLVLDLALALREKGYEVSASGCGLTD